MNSRIIENIRSELVNLLGKTAVYSRSGGGASSILLLNFDVDVSIWGWNYWEISRYDKLLATSEDDCTAVTGPVAVAARSIEGKRLEGFSIFSDLSLGLYFEDNIDLQIFTRDEKIGELTSWELWLFQKEIAYIIWTASEITIDRDF